MAQQPFSEGEISIDLYPGSADPVRIASSRPLHVSRIFVGKTPPEVSAAIPLLFNVCATAQARASLLALQRAMLIQPDPQAECARDILVLMENAREHLFRIVVDWPPLFDAEIDTTLLPQISRLVADTSQALFTSGQAFNLDSRLDWNRTATAGLVKTLDQLLEEQVFSMSVTQWLNLDGLAALSDWAQQSPTLAATTVAQIQLQDWGHLGQSQVQPLPEMDEESLIAKLLGESVDGFIQAPTWDNMVCETTAYSRQLEHPLVDLVNQQYGNGLLTRWIARLVELALIPQQLGSLLQQLEQESYRVTISEPGLAQVEAARGRLVHYAAVDNERVSEYRILAPTEWNFHPRGLIGQSLQHLIKQTPVNPDKAARCLINVIDPCVGYQLHSHS